MVKIITIKTGIRKQENGIAIVETKIVDRPAPCKNCKENPRRYGASTCQGCANKYKTQRFEEERLKKKVEQATQKKD
jgi:hypothetical protein